MDVANQLQNGTIQLTSGNSNYSSGSGGDSPSSLSPGRVSYFVKTKDLFLFFFVIVPMSFGGQFGGIGGNSNSSTSSTPTGTSNAGMGLNPASKYACAICGDKASGKHYGVHRYGNLVQRKSFNHK